MCVLRCGGERVHLKHIAPVQVPQYLQLRDAVPTEADAFLGVQEGSLPDQTLRVRASTQRAR